MYELIKYFCCLDLSPIKSTVFISIGRTHNLLFHFIAKNITESLQAVSSPEIFAVVQSGLYHCPAHKARNST